MCQINFILARRAECGHITAPPPGRVAYQLIIMETNVQTEDVVLQKTRELCDAIVQAPQFQNIRQQVDSFMADAQAQQQYESLSEKGRQLHDKQHQGLELGQAEIAAFEAEREAFFRNPVARGFVDAQEAMHHIQEEVSQFVSKTFELGRVPSAEDLDSGSCGSGCGCHH
jgi:cell fate (sporulation/competence/biofilm development) regulator YlbF (YheA/YmcA/DUF963 family)